MTRTVNPADLFCGEMREFLKHEFGFSLSHIKELLKHSTYFKIEDEWEKLNPNEFIITDAETILFRFGRKKVFRVDYD